MQDNPAQMAGPSLSAHRGDPPSEGSSHTIEPPPTTPEDPWAQKYLLTFDGGGIRGYSSLLIVKELMRIISIIELEKDRRATSSYYPLPFVKNKGSQIPDDGVVLPGVRYLPVHYFDYMAGTSTGGLIAIMLSRLRMNVDDCLLEYETMGKLIFGKPRTWSIRGPLFFPKEKYNHKNLRKAIEDVISRRATTSHGEMQEHFFRSSENRCRTVVFSVNQNVQDNRGVYAFRTYQHLAPEDGNQFELNPGPAHNIPTWQVARATSAAPSYFKEMKIGNTVHLDGGFGNANNPTRFAWLEVNQMHGDSPKAIALTLSIGTGLPRHIRFRNDRYIGKWIAYFKFMAHIAADSEEAHLEMFRQHKSLGRSENYHRFNVDTGLEDIKMGEWKMRSTPQGKVSLTLEDIAAATTTYVQSPAVQERLRHFAEILVNNRRQRGRDSRWNNVAMGQQYHCILEGCPSGKICHETHTNLRHHLKTDHGYADTTQEERQDLDRIIERGKILVSE